MNVVYYSLVLTSDPSTHQNQWIRSIGSLRRFNKTIPVYLFLFNEPTQAILDRADEFHVTVHCLGAYRDCLRELAGEEGAVLSSIPTLHKLVPLGHLGTPLSQVLFLDCDTFLFSDVATLFPIYQQYQWYAREEPHSRRSLFPGYKPSHIDEDTLSRIALETGAVPVPPYNSGVVMFNHGLAAQLFALRREFLSYAWRLTLGASLSPAVTLAPELRKGLADSPVDQFENRIEYPSDDYWIVDQIALSLTLGRIPGFSHGQFRMSDVLQNGEFMIYRSYKTKCTVAHYFRGNEELFFEDAGIGSIPPIDVV